ncbi:MAG: uroporphyrinogen decarboxylase family protein, partial [Ruthenibacterium sp.]
VPSNDVGTVRHHDITRLDDPRIATENPLKDGILDTYAAILPEYKEKYLIMPGITGPYSQLVFMMGLENILLLMYDEPEALHKALAQRAALTL